MSGFCGMSWGQWCFDHSWELSLWCLLLSVFPQMLWCPKNWGPWEVVFAPRSWEGEKRWWVFCLRKPRPPTQPVYAQSHVYRGCLVLHPFLYNQNGPWRPKLDLLPVPPGRQSSWVEIGSKYQGEYRQEAACLILTWVQILTLLLPSWGPAL